MAMLMNSSAKDNTIVPIGGQLPSGQVAALQLDSSANLKINLVADSTPLTPASPTAANVGTISGSVVALNASRKGLVLVNTSSNYISLGFGVEAVLYSGITLNPSGGVFVMDGFTFCTSQIYAIASGVSSNLAIQEYA